MGDFRAALLDQEQITTLMILYYRPDHRHLLQEFTWQYMDAPPRFYRTHRFLNHWKTNITATIREVRLAVAGSLIPTSFTQKVFYSA